MVIRKAYECKLCGLRTHLKTDFKRHEMTRKHIIRVKKKEETTSNKKNLKNVNPNVNIVNPNVNLKKYKCRYCSKIFKYRQSRYRHELNICNKTENSITIKEYDKELYKMKKQIENLLINMSTITNNNTITNSNNVNMNQNIVINSYGNENKDYITSDLLTDLLKKPYAAIQSYLKTLHFNEQHPENHNIKIPNKKQKYATVYNSGNWELKHKKDVIEDIVDNGYNVIDTHFDQVGDNLEKIKKVRFNNFQEKFETDINTKKNIEVDTEMLILNGS